MFFLGNASGHDFQFHIASWMDAANQWREGVVYPRWAEWANWGFGEPRFVFYPPESWILGAALGALLPWELVPGAFIWLALVLAGMAMWKLAREWLPAPYAAVAAVLFAVNPYHLVIVYYRSDFAELLAGVFLPLVVWSALHVTQGEWRRVPYLAGALAATWLANAPAGVIATYAMALILVAVCLLRKNLRPLLLGAAAMAGGFGLAAFYILPAAWERRWIQIAQVTADNLYFVRNFLFTHSNDPDFVKFNWKVSYVAVAVMIVTCGAAIAAARERRGFRDLFWVLATIALVSSLLMFPLTSFVWRALPELRFVQFPWRWLDQLAVAFAFFIAAAISRARRRWVGWFAGFLVFAALVAAATAMIRTAWWDSGDVPAMVASIHSSAGYRGTDEYDPVGCDHYELPGDPDDTERDEGVSAVPAQQVEKLDPESADVVPASDVKLQLGQWSSEHREFTLEVAQPMTIAVKLLNYPAWEVRMDGMQIHPGASHDTGQMLVPVPPGTHRVEIHFRRTWDRTTGAAISIISAISLLVFLRRRKAPTPVSL
jgi:6-pyruvoyl-tetrahydropterin synthase related domain